jgi:hypothetical protein
MDSAVKLKEIEMRMKLKDVFTELDKDEISDTKWHSFVWQMILMLTEDCLLKVEAAQEELQGVNSFQVYRLKFNEILRKQFRSLGYTSNSRIKIKEESKFSVVLRNWRIRVKSKWLMRNLPEEG